MEFPDPVISLAIEPKTKADQEKMGIALQRPAAEDPSFRLHTDEESGQTIISGMGELHLEIIVDRMKREFGVEANIGRPQVTYRETLRKAVKDIEGKFVRQSGGKGQYGHVVLSLEPLAAGSGFVFEDATKGGWCRGSTSRRWKRVARSHEYGCAGGLSGGGCESDPDVWFLP